MRRKTLLHLVPEGWAVLAVLVAALIVVNAAAGFWFAAPLFFPIGIALLFFRDSPRDVPAEPMAVIAPVDGRVIHRREGYDPLLDREAIKLSIRVNPFGNYLVRAPVEGTVLELTSEAHDRTGGVATRFRTDEGDEIVMVTVAGWLGSARPCRNSIGERVGQGRCMGMRRLARRVDLYLPVNSRVEIELGDQLRAGACVLAKLVHKSTDNARSNET